MRLSSTSNGFAKYCFSNIIKNFSPMWGLNPRPWDKESHALPTELAGLYEINEDILFVNDHLFFEIFVELSFVLLKI